MFTVGLLAELIPMVEVISHWTKLVSFAFGSLGFVIGGLAECMENKVFSSLSCDTGYFGAVLNTIGSFLFLAGSLLGFSHGPSAAYWGSFLFGIGSILFAVGSAVMIVMWKDEQFGLTFLAALNKLGGPNGQPVVVHGAAVEEEPTFSLRGTIFIMVYCAAATMSVYNFNTEMAEIGATRQIDGRRGFFRAFNALLPCIFAHLLLALNAGVIKTPKVAPFHQLYIGCRVLVAIMLVVETWQFYATLSHASRS